MSVDPNLEATEAKTGAEAEGEEAEAEEEV